MAQTIMKAISQYDIVIIGCGAAGVTAAATLARAGRRVLALEAQSRIGGRVHTVPFGDGVVELGAEWIHGQQKNRVFELGIQTNVPLKPQDLNFDIFRSNGMHCDRDLQEFIDQIISFCFAVVEFPPEKPIPLGQHVTGKVLAFIKENKPELYNDEDFLEHVLEFLNLLTNNYCASNDWNDISSWDKYEPVEGHQHMSWHKYGYQTFFDILLNKHNQGPGLPTLEIKLNTEVTRITSPKEPTQKVTVECKDGQIYTANTVIVTVSLGVLKEKLHTLFSPKLPEPKVKAIEQMSIGVMDKIILAFDKPWWPEGCTFIGFLWKGEDKKRVLKEDYWVTRIFGASSPLGSSNALTLWTSGDVAKLVETLPEEVIKRKCTELLRRFLGASFTIPEPTSIIKSTWFSNPFTRGSYSFDNHAVMIENPNARADLAAPLTDSGGKPRVLFAGEATDETHFSTVHGASDTGYREAMRLLKADSKL